MINNGERTFIFLMGCFIYSMLEIVARGYTHWTMALTGGVCLIILYEISTRFPDTPMWKKCLTGAAIITFIEFSVGFTVNIILRWNVWDYSHMPFNLMGQVCLPFSVLWFFLCFIGYAICRYIRRRVFSPAISHRREN